MNNLIFRSPKISDLIQLLDYINTLSKEKTYIRKQGGLISLEGERKYLSELIKDIENKKAEAIFAFIENELIGVADLKLGFGAERHVGLFGITVRKEFRGQGIGKELMKRVIAVAKENLPTLEIITLSVFADNKVARNLYQSFGFREFGSLPKGVIRKGEYSDHVYMYLSAISS